MTDKRAVRKQQRRDHNRRSILEAAEKVFAERGFGPATMDDIAAEAQFSKATLYRYFEGKGEIFSEIIETSFQEARRLFKEIRMRDESATSRLTEMVRTSLDTFHRKQSIARIFLIERTTMKRILKMDIENHMLAGEKHKCVPENYRRIIENIFEDMCGVLKEGIENGEFRSVDPAAACQILGAMIRGFHFRGPMGDPEFSQDESTDLLMDFFLNGIRKLDTFREGEST